jgi:hypothetical protein
MKKASLAALLGASLFLCSASSFLAGAPVSRFYAELGPSGGSGGRAFSDLAEIESLQGTPFRVAEVRVSHGKSVDSVQMVLQIFGAQSTERPLKKHGGDGGTIAVLRLGEDECIIGISGKYGRVVDSLRVHTNLRPSPITYGGKGGDAEFNYWAPTGTEIIGFYGREGRIVDAIGVILRWRDGCG